MRKLYLLRHAEAEEGDGDDRARLLTARGESQARKVGRWCRLRSLPGGPIVSSPLARARRTAELVGDALGVRSELLAALEPGMTATRGRALLEERWADDALLVVGHEPDLSHWATDLLGAPQVRLRLKKATLARLAFPDGKLGLATLDFLVPVALL